MRQMTGFSVHVADSLMKSALLILCMTSLEGNCFVLIVCCKMFNAFVVLLSCFSLIVHFKQL